MMPQLSPFLLVFITLAYWTYIIVAASPQALSTLTLANTTAPPQHSIECVQSDLWVTRKFIAGDCFTALAVLEDWEVQMYVVQPNIVLCTHHSLDRERKHPLAVFSIPLPYTRPPFTPTSPSPLLTPHNHPFSFPTTEHLFPP